MKNSKYRQFFFWENLISKNENLTEGYFRGITLTKESVFINTVIVNSDTGILYDWWICFPDTEAALGFIQNIYITSAYNSYLSPKEDYVAIIMGTPEELLDALEDSENCSNKEDIPEMRSFLEKADRLWVEEDLFSAMRDFSSEFNERWGIIGPVFFYFNVFRDAQEVGQYVVDGYEAEKMTAYFTEETGITREQWQDIYTSVYDNDFMRKKFMDILNNKICKML
ncbi:MAG: hypothetical protein Q8930_10395 [Bacillota bacterium]|nr:hypothetical protein [Bacillota bacterium]